MTERAAPSLKVQTDLERRLNAIRLLAVIALFLMEKVNYSGLHWGPIHVAAVEGVTPTFHKNMIWLLLSWASLTWSFWLVLDSQLYRPFFRYYVGGLDLLALSSVIFLADGAASPLVQIYFIILALAFLRNDPQFSRVSFVSILFSYFMILFLPAKHRLDLVVPPYKSFLFILTLSILFACFRMSQKRRPL
jgi:hypothetical protein